MFLSITLQPPSLWLLWVFLRETHVDYNFFTKSSEIARWILAKVFVRLAPIFILGFVVQMYQKQLLQHLYANYAVLVGWLVIFLLAYIILLFAIGASLRLKETVRHITNLLPAAGVALSTGCSFVHNALDDRWNRKKSTRSSSSQSDYSGHNKYTANR